MGLGYTLPPTKTKQNIFQIQNDFKRLASLLKHKEHMASNPEPQPTDTTEVIVPFKLKHYVHKQWIEKYEQKEEHRQRPKHINIMARTDINNFINNTKSAIITHIKSRYHYHSHVTQHLKNIQTLNQMQKDGHIIIKKSDKTNKLIIMDKADYTQKALQHLSDTKYYAVETSKTEEQLMQLAADAYNPIKRLILHSDLNGLQKQQLIRYTQPNLKTTRFPRIYFNPKTHKQNMPLRPIVSGINWTTENTAILLDETLKPIIYSKPHIPKDTFQFIQILEDCQYDLLTLQHQDIYLVTFDVEALYTSIPQDKAIQRITDTLQEANTLIPPSIFKEITRYILHNNYFKFQGTIYKQQHGIAMGNPAGGAIANTYMLKWDQHLLNHPKFSPFIYTYARYHDDGFTIWNGPLQELQEFLQYINTIDPDIKTTAQYGKQVNYLDLDIAITNHNILLTRTHRKATATDTYLDYRSAHPRHLKANLPMSILFRSFIICNTQASFQLEKTQILTRFKHSNYPARVLQDTLNKVLNKYKIPTTNNQPAYADARRKALANIGQSKQQTQQMRDNIFMPITHWPYTPYKTHINKQTWTSSLTNCRIRYHKPTLSYKQPPNLLRMVTNSNH
mgnify:CR=1 FL=1